MSDSSDEKREEARQRILQVMPHLRLAMSDAAKEAGEGGTVEIGIIAIAQDGKGGKVVVRFNAGEFWEDLALVVDAPPQTEESQNEAKAQQIVDMVRASGAEIISTPVKGRWAQDERQAPVGESPNEVLAHKLLPGNEVEAFVPGLSAQNYRLVLFRQRSRTSIGRQTSWISSGDPSRLPALGNPSSLVLYDELLVMSEHVAAGDELEGSVLCPHPTALPQLDELACLREGLVPEVVVADAEADLLHSCSFSVHAGSIGTLGGMPSKSCW